MLPKLTINRKRVLAGLFIGKLILFIFTFNYVKDLTAQTTQFQTPYVTRAEAAMVLLTSRTPNISSIMNTGKFTDITPGAWYEKYMLMAERYGIITADTRGRVFPERPVTRAEFLAMMTRTFGLAEDIAHTYRDVSSNAWYAHFAGLAERHKLFPKDSTLRTLSPEKLMTHAEVSTAVHALLASKSQALYAVNDARVATDDAQYKLKLSLRISSQTERVTQVNTTALRPTQTPIHGSAGALSEESLNLLRDEIFALVLRERQKAGISLVRYSTVLEKSAQKYAKEMADGGFFGHVSPTGQTLKNRIEVTGYYRQDPTCQCIERFSIGENLARGQKTAMEVMTAWMKSESHRAAILNPDFKEMGVGIYAGLWVQHFGGVTRTRQ